MAFTNDTGGMPRAAMGRRSLQDYTSEANCIPNNGLQSPLERVMDELNTQVVALGEIALSLHQRLNSVLRAEGPECGGPEQPKQLADSVLVGQLSDKAQNLASTRLLLQSLLDRLVL